MGRGNYFLQKKATLRDSVRISCYIIPLVTGLKYARGQ